MIKISSMDSGSVVISVSKFAPQPQSLLGFPLRHAFQSIASDSNHFAAISNDSPVSNHFIRIRAHKANVARP
jgi:hypothetical protein